MGSGKAATRIEFRLLGPLEVVVDDVVVPIAGPRQSALLAFLLLHAGEVVASERLIDEVWGEHPPAQARKSLQVTVHGLRKLLGPDRVETVGGGYRLRVEPGELDSGRFLELAEKAPGAALELWRGPALAGLEAPFAIAEAARLDELRLAATERRIERQLGRGDHERVVGEIEALIAEYPFRERLRGQLMLALYRTGRQAEALDAYRAARRILVEQLGIEPTRELQELERAILRQDPSLSPPTAARSRLPSPLTTLVGRELEIAAIVDLLGQAEVRLLTLAGPGGTGKTRLALAAASTLEPELADGVLFVDLAPLQDADLVIATIARVAGILERSEGNLSELLAGWLADRELLLVLDNFEHLLEAASGVASLLTRAARVTTLVTSRALLRVSGEHEYAVPPLTRGEAVTLFVARARATGSGFELTDENTRAIEDVCAALDDLPLAIELAAARARLLTPTELRDRLSEHLRLLTSGPDDAPARQRALSATLDWSFDLLPREESLLCARLGVFLGGWSRQAAEAVCGADLDQLELLADHSLIRFREGRFRMLETIRRHSLDRLAREGHEADVRHRHAGYFLALVEGYEPMLRDPAALTALERDHDNVRAALGFAAAADLPELRLRLCAAVWRFWYIRGFLSEGRAHLESALAADAGAAPSATRAAALRGVATLAWVQGDYTASTRYAEWSLKLFRELEDEPGMIQALIGLGLSAQAQGDLALAKRCQEDARRLAHEHDRPRDEGAALANLGDVAVMEHDYERARELFRESLALCRAAGDSYGTAIALLCLGLVAMRGEGEPADAARLFRESLQLFRTLGFQERMASCLAGLAAVTAEADPERAARLLGASEALLQAIGARADTWWDRPLLSETAKTLRIRLGEEAFTRAFAGGREEPAREIEHGTLTSSDGKH